MLVKKLLPSILAVLCSSILGFSQNSTSAVTIRVGIIVDSPRERIQDMVPQMRDRIVRIASDKKHNIVGVWLSRDDEVSLKQAKPDNCDYVLHVTVTELSQIEAGGTAPDVNRTGAENAIDAPIEVSYKLESVNDGSIVFRDRREVQPQQYPLDQGATAFQTVVERAIDGAVSASVSKLKKKL
jgi:hypothetical protein